MKVLARPAPARGRAFPRPWRRIRAGARRPSVLVGLARLLGLGAEAQPTRIAWIAAAAALVIVVEGAAIVALAPSRSDTTYRTATEKPKEGTDVLIAFAPDARISDISAFLQDARLDRRRAARRHVPRRLRGQTAVERGDGSANQELARVAPRTIGAAGGQLTTIAHSGRDLFRLNKGFERSQLAGFETSSRAKLFGRRGVVTNSQALCG